MNVVFAIGCKRYSDPDVAQLKYADQDAQRFVETVMETQDPDNTEAYLLHDEHENERFRPTRSNILYFLSRGEDRDKSSDLDFLFFYFSGHGWSSQVGTDYLLTSDSVVRMPDITAIPVPMLEGHLRNWEAKHVVLFIDACRTAMTGGKSATVPEESSIDVNSLRIPGMVTFCSCEPGQTSYEADEIHSGVFTEGVCRALSSEGRCSTIQELDNYLNNKVPRIASEYGLPRQRPYSRVQPLGVEREIIVSQRTLEGWRSQEHKGSEQIPLQSTTQEGPLDRYRQVVEWVWTGEQLSERDVQRLNALASELGLSADTTTAIEREIMGDTSEAIFERQVRLGEHYTRARRSHQNQDWQEVVDIFEQIRAENPSYPDREGLLASAREALETQRLAAEEPPGASVAKRGDDEVRGSVTAHAPVDQPADDGQQSLPKSGVITPSNADDIKLLRSLEGHAGAVVTVAFSPDSKLLASGAGDKTVRLWRTNDGAILRIVGHTDTVSSIAFSPDGNLLAAGAGDGSVRLWRVKDGTLVREIKHEGWLPSALEGRSVNSVAFSPNGQLLASSSLKAGKLWQVADGTLVRDVKGRFVTNLWVLSMVFSPDGQLLASANSKKMVQLWRVKDGALVREIKTGAVAGGCLAFSPDGHWLVSGGGKVVRLWQVKDGALVSEMKHKGFMVDVTSVVFSPDGRLIASTTDLGATARLWSTRDGTLVGEINECRIDITFSPDGRLLASGGTNVKLWGTDATDR